MALFRGEPTWPVVSHFQPTRAPQNPVNGDMWYDSTLGSFQGMVNGVVSSIGGSGSGAWKGAIDPTNASYGAKFDAQLITDGTITSGSNVITCPNADCHFLTTAKVGHQIYATNLTNDISILTGGGTVMLNSTILSVDSDTQVHSVAAATGNLTATATLVWGTDDTTALAAAYAAALSACVSLQLPVGRSIVSSALFNNTMPQSCLYSGAYGPVSIFGAGGFASMLLISPNFNMASCTGGSGAATCFLSSGTLQWHDFGIDGVGIDPGAGASGKIAVQVNGAPNVGNQYIRNFNMLSWGATRTGFTGLQVTGGSAQYLQQVTVDGVGSTNCDVNNGGGNAITFEEVICGVTNGTNLFVHGGSSPFSSHGGYYGYNTGTNPVNIQNNATNVSFFGDYFPSGPAASGCAAIDVRDTSTAYFDGVIILSSCVSGFGIGSIGTSSQVRIRDSFLQTTATGTALIANTSGGSFFIEGGNNIQGGPTSGGNVNLAAGTKLIETGYNTWLAGANVNNVVNGNWFGGTNSAIGTACAIGNFALTSGWGASSVTSVAANGNIQGCHVTITGAAGAAGPVLTWTYPAVPPLVPSSCHLSGVSGTLTGVTTGTPGTTTVAFTFTGTPSAQTYSFDVGCP